MEYGKLTGVPGTDLALLFGIFTRSCHQDVGCGLPLVVLPDIDNKTPATDAELLSLGDLINEDSLLWFRDIRDGGAVGRLLGGGPFSADDAIAIRRSFSRFGLRAGFSFTEWIKARSKLWKERMPWTEGLCSLFGSVQEELISQWQALPLDSSVRELEWSQKDLESIVVAASEKSSEIRPVVPEQSPEQSCLAQSSTASAIVGNGRKLGRKARLPESFVAFAGTLWRKALSDGRRRVRHEQLRGIASRLDTAGYLPPGKYLEGQYGVALRAFNSRNSNSKIGPIKNWSQLVDQADKDHLRGMRRLLSRCARGLSGHSLSAN